MSAGALAGPMFHLGLYHLFYQYNPHCNVPLCAREWGHSVYATANRTGDLGCLPP